MRTFAVSLFLIAFMTPATAQTEREQAALIQQQADTCRHILESEGPMSPDLQLCLTILQAISKNPNPPLDTNAASTVEAGQEQIAQALDPLIGNPFKTAESSLGTPSSRFTCDFPPEKRIIACTATDETIYYWDIGNPQDIPPLFVNGAARPLDGTYLGAPDECTIMLAVRADAIARWRVVGTAKGCRRFLPKLMTSASQPADSAIVQATNDRDASHYANGPLFPALPPDAVASNPRVAVIDRGAFSPGTPNGNAREIEPSLAPLLRAVMLESGANLLINKSAVMMSAKTSDIAPQATERRDRSLLGTASPDSPNSNPPVSIPSVTRFVVVNRQAASTLLGTHDARETDEMLAPAIHNLMQQRRADFALEYSFVILSKISIDITREAVGVVKGGNARRAIDSPLIVESSLPPRIVVINRNAILGQSVVGKGLVAQTSALVQTAQNEFRERAEALQKGTPASGAEFSAKREAIQNDAKQRQAQIQGGFAKGAREIEIALEPIFRQLMTEHSADLLLASDGIALAAVDVDITDESIKRLDEAFPTVTLTVP